MTLASVHPLDLLQDLDAIGAWFSDSGWAYLVAFGGALLIDRLDQLWRAKRDADSLSVFDYERDAVSVPGDES